jgi:hypothetical protein
MGRLPHYLPKEKRNPKGAKPLKKHVELSLEVSKKGIKVLRNLSFILFSSI